MNESSTTGGAVRIRRYCEADAQLWDALVERSINGTLMQTRRFLAYHPPDRFRDHSLMFFDEASRPIAVFPAAEVAQDGGLLLRSHPGSSYGGLVVDDDLSNARADALVAGLCRYASDNGFRGIWLRHSEKVFHRRWCDELDAALFRADFQMAGRELSCAVPLDALGVDDAPANFSSAARRAVRKAIKSGVVAAASADFAAYWTILENNLREQHGVRPTHTLDEIERLRELFPERIQLVAAELDGRMTAGVVLFHMNVTASHTMYMAQDYRHQALRSLNLVLAVAQRESARRGARWLNYGISSIPGTGGREMNEGLHAFKRTCGGGGVLRDLFVKNL